VGLTTLIVGTATLSAVYGVVLWALRRRIGIAGLWRRVPFIGRFA
jgi:hypothetical protein